jgi:hypothetical protein
MPRHTGQHRGATGRSTQQLDHLHRHEAERETHLEFKRSCVRDYRLYFEIAGTPSQYLKQPGVPVDRDDAVAAAYEVERDPAGARAEL